MFSHYSLQLKLTDYINIVHHTAHPHVMSDGTVYNIGLSITQKGPQYNVVCFYPRRVITGKILFCSKAFRRRDFEDKLHRRNGVPKKFPIRIFVHKTGNREELCMFDRFILIITITCLFRRQVRQRKGTLHVRSSYVASVSCR